MIIRIGKVIKTYSAEGKVQVSWADTESSSLPLPMLTFNNEYSMPNVGDMVATLHFETGSSKGICLGTYYGNGNVPPVISGYFKTFDKKSSFTSDNGASELKAKTLALTCDYGSIDLESLIKKLENFEQRISALES